MFWKRQQQESDTPWYRSRKYKGNFNNDEKVELDSIRRDAKHGDHPAARIEDLPNEVETYIYDLEHRLLESRTNVHEFVLLSIIMGSIYMLDPFLL